FTPPGGTVAVVAGTEGAFATIDVRDSGAGIAPEFLPHLFDPFRQSDQGASRRGQEGLGLGLALVQRLTELHGGTIACESEGVGRGTVFRVSLPLAGDSVARLPEVEAMSRVQETSALPSLAGIRVLLIDDQREARDSLAALLSQAGAAVCTAASGKDAMSRLESSDAAELPEVILCDIAMPDEDGYKTLRRIRQWERAKDDRGRRPVLALSAFTQSEHRIRALSEGFQMHIAKPVAPAELIAVIASLAREARV
ncbi:MAG: response regulator, partial [Bacillota bacterium]